ncbi:hypothetical protein [Cellulomonas phragmiteti]|uniref:MFS transporter n=1 Tax=Cellulomonas phragmiteti TaxID=478780 RepID=A0ABQ4DIW0_9CELL|nr:hypothetical protein [Cellulomonas phragmiteti]GIG39284.1 hypothetical protein Cph01nite_10460 [Cellulomonas phragmiteti]
MSSPGVGSLRAVRVVALAAVLVGLSVVSHQLAGGTRPAAVPLLVLTGLTIALVVPLTAGRIGLPRLLVVLGIGQVGLHVAFGHLAALAPTTAVHHHHGAASDGGMLAAHAATTLVVALVVRHGDALLWAMWAWLTRRRFTDVPAVQLEVPAVRAHGDLWNAHAADRSDAVRARAPPALV